MLDEIRFCAQGGCDWKLLHPERSCAGCGFLASERVRRRELPLVQGEDGLRRMQVGLAQEPEEPETARPPAITLEGRALQVACQAMAGLEICVRGGRERRCVQKRPQSPADCAKCWHDRLLRKAQRQAQKEGMTE